MNDNMQDYQSEVTGVVKKSKKHGAIIAAIVAVVVVGGSAVAYATVPLVQNTVKLAVMSPDKYCADVYDNCIEKLKKDVDKKYEDFYGDSENASVSATLNVELEDEVMSFVEDELGYEIFDKLSLSADLFSDTSESTAEVKLNLKADDNNVISANMIADPKDKMLYFQIPEMSDKYISTDISDSFDDMQIDEDGMMLTTDLSIKDFDDVLPRYAELFTNAIKSGESELEKGYEGTARGVDYKYNKIITTLDQDNYEDLFNDIADEAENDDVLKKYYTETLKMSEEDYNSIVDDIRDTADSMKEEDFEHTLETYVDPLGTIRGITISGDENTYDQDEISFIMAKDGDDIAIELKISDRSDDFVFGIDAKEDGSKYSGKLEMSDGTESHSVDFSDLEMIDNKFISGSIACDLSSECNSALGKINLDFEKADNAQRISTKIDGIGKFGLDIKQEKAKDKEKINVPEDAISTDDIDQYLEDIDGEKIVSDVCDALKIKKEDAEDIVDSLFDNGFFGTDDDSDEDIDYYDNLDEDDENDTVDTDYSSINSEYPFKSLDINISNEKVVFPVINPALIPEDQKATMVEADGYDTIYVCNDSVSLCVENNTENAAAISESKLTSIDIYGDATDASVNGIKIGSSLEDVKTAFDIKKDIDSKASYIFIEDSDGTFSSVTIGFDNGKVSNISLFCWD